MKSIRLTVLLVTSLLISACGPVSVRSILELPEGTQTKKDIAISDLPLSKNNKASSYVMPDSNFEVFTNKTGSATAGLLLGPLGVAGNVLYVQRMAEDAAKLLFSDIQPKKISQNLQTSLKTANTDYNFTISSSKLDNGILATPSIAIIVSDDKTITASCHLTLAETRNKSEHWSGIYTADFSKTISVGDKTYINNELVNDAVNCLNLTFTAFRMHSENTLRPAYYLLPNGSEINVLAYANNEKSLYFSTSNRGVHVMKQMPSNLKFR